MISLRLQSSLQSIIPGGSKLLCSDDVHLGRSRWPCGWLLSTPVLRESCLGFKLAKYAITRLTTHITCDLMSDLVICKHRKEYGLTWHRMSLLRPDVIEQNKSQAYVTNVVISYTDMILIAERNTNAEVEYLPLHVLCTFSCIGLLSECDTMPSCSFSPRSVGIDSVTIMSSRQSLAQPIPSHCHVQKYIIEFESAIWPRQQHVYSNTNGTCLLIAVFHAHGIVKHWRLQTATAPVLQMAVKTH